MTPENFRKMLDEANKLLQENTRKLEEEVKSLRKEHVQTYKFYPQWSNNLKKTVRIYCN